ncbi:Cystine ABC transporter, periplasmic cystine-binding protein FliY [Halomonas citrativorans]|uniref:Cystine ABC transporter, periplasmic cystine-binding protein FliY n=1 Tax=Halomonas citrativorans TaxID=2742612 RepID=A0A1R4HNB4_9GAMM|nr:ABC transporter substrate-binding protein [Halomonas citrativorans]SJN09045.1 Cystine ABC transporter, periplasmic cystine-binding protein FliY [Halomonas citrativorans]
MSKKQFFKKIIIGSSILTAVCFAQQSFVYAADIPTIEPGTLLIGSDMTYPPYIYLEDGTPSGFEVDFMNAVAEHMGLEAEYVDTRFAQLIVGLRSNRYDVIASLLYITPERAEVIDYVPHTQTGSSILTASNYAESPQEPRDLCGMRVSSIQGASWVPKLTKVSDEHCTPNGLDEIDIREFATAPEATQAILAGAVEAQFADAAVAQLAVENTGDALKITSEELIYPIPVGLGVNSSNSEIKEAITSAIENMKETGEYDEILSAYNLSAPDPDEVEAALSNN